MRAFARKAFAVAKTTARSITADIQALGQIGVARSVERDVLAVIWRVVEQEIRNSRREFSLAVRAALSAVIVDRLAQIAALEESAGRKAKREPARRGEPTLSIVTVQRPRGADGELRTFRIQLSYYAFADMTDRDARARAWKTVAEAACRLIDSVEFYAVLLSAGNQRGTSREGPK